MGSKGDLILVSRIARATPYSPEYLSLLVRKGRIRGEKVGRNWHISQTDLAAYLNERVQQPRLVLADAGVDINPKFQAPISNEISNSNFQTIPVSRFPGVEIDDMSNKTDAIDETSDHKKTARYPLSD
ncbi:MAG: helix-turn-helix domain-containing protein, partial [Patescibacteria group bacterium]